MESGQKMHLTSQSELVVHTWAIPLASTFDATDLRKSSTNLPMVTLKHGYQRECACRCSYNYDGNKATAGELVPPDCPCVEAGLRTSVSHPPWFAERNIFEEKSWSVKPHQWMVCHKAYYFETERLRLSSRGSRCLLRLLLLY